MRVLCSFLIMVIFFSGSGTKESFVSNLSEGDGRSSLCDSF